ncbi:PRC-barrel domain-containing protein [Propylenella binzhouense]|nr:PRC-barrel domain-containing protein [Propylenella binzhouense]
MIRRLMASSAIFALVSAGALGTALAQNNPATPAQSNQPAAAAQAGGAGTVQTQGFFAEHANLASRIMGQPVYSSQDPEADRIGDVNDLVVDEHGKVSQAVIGVGGFLGIGEKDVAVPIDQVAVIERDGKVRLVYASTREQLESAESFDRAAYDPQRRNADTANTASTTGSGMVGGPGTSSTMAGDMSSGAGQTNQNAANQNAAERAGNASPQSTTAQADNSAAGTQTAQAGGNSGFVNFDENAQIRASDMIGKEVYGQDDRSIGEIADIVLAPDGKTRAAVIDVGGFLGVGEKPITIPFDQLQMQAKADSAAAAGNAGQNNAGQGNAAQRAAADGSDMRISVAMTRDQIEQAPEYDRDAEAANMNAAGTGMAANRAAGTSGGAASNQATDANRAAQANQQAATGSPAPTGSQQAMTNTGGNAAVQPQEVSADDLLGAKVVGTRDDDIGEVEDVVFTKSGDIQAVVIDVGGFLGIGEKPVAVQYDTLNVQKDKSGDLRVMVNTTEDQLKDAPEYRGAD